MAAYAEGLNILKNANAGKASAETDAETAPLEHPEYYQYDIDIPEVAEVWRRGSVIGSWLLDLTAAALHDRPTFATSQGRVSDSGEGRWTSIAAIEEGVPAPVSHDGAVRALRLARPRRLRRQGALGDAQAVRRPRGEEQLRTTGSRSSPTPRRSAARGAEMIAEAARGGRRRARRLHLARQRRARPRGSCSRARGPRAWTGPTTVIFQVDERVAPRRIRRPQPHPPSRASRSAPRRASAPMPVNDDDLEAAAAATPRAARRARPGPPRASGPTATRPRSSPATPCSRSPTTRVALTAGEYQGRRRMTLTYPELQRVRRACSGWSPGGEGRGAAEADRPGSLDSRRPGASPAASR